MDYIEVRFQNEMHYNDIIVAWLGENNYEMFEEKEDGVCAYIPANLYNEEELKTALQAIPESEKNIRFTSSLIKDQNWNTKWETNFEPVVIGKQIYVRAPFHQSSSQFLYEIVIEPKMSFGTGHHATTSLVMELMLKSNFTGKSVLDMGCGTAVLAILAHKMGAKNILAIDIDEWAYQNSIENCSGNNAGSIVVKLGNSALLKNLKFDFILANINRNILLEDLPVYTNSLKPEGEIILSGILIDDFQAIINRCNELNLELIHKADRNNWLALHLIKNHK